MAGSSGDGKQGVHTNTFGCAPVALGRRSTRSTQAISWICVGGKPELSTSSNGWYKKNRSCFGRGNGVVSKTKSVTRSCPHSYEQTAKAFVIEKTLWRPDLTLRRL